MSATFVQTVGGPFNIPVPRGWRLVKRGVSRIGDKKAYFKWMEGSNMVFEWSKVTKDSEGQPASGLSCLIRKAK